MARKMPLDEIATDDLIYADVTLYSLPEYGEELGRVNSVINDHVMLGVDMTMWFDRENHIREMRRMAFPNEMEATKS